MKEQVEVSPLASHGAQKNLPAPVVLEDSLSVGAFRTLGVLFRKRAPITMEPPSNLVGS